MVWFAPQQSPEPLAGVRGVLLLWSGWVVGPLAWAVQENFSYALVPWVCRTGQVWVLHAVAFAALLVVVRAGLVAWRRRRVLASPAAAALGERRGPRHFLATGGLLISVLSAAGIIAASLPNFLVDACAGAT